MLVIPLFEPFVRVFNHDDGGIHHRADGNGNASQRHNVGVQSLEMHDDKGNTQAKRQRDNRDQRRSNVPQEQGADDGHHDKLFKQFGTQVVDCPIDELAAIVGGHNLNPFRQAGLQRLQLISHRRDDFTRIFARTQDHHATRNFPLPVQLGNTAAHFRTRLYAGNIAKVNRYPVLAGFQDDVIEIVHRLQIAAGPDHILRFRHFN
ncbi:Uncharacterised protein [Enterobacter cloacae]|nr:Uncharacterised protein [Enterobacter asburiae]CZW15292.1 Uncharacterised protein [Enterobacter cloacae]CZU44385.1 Uncharacterised protein [Enterobacter asburiae]SAD00082.1 Uncharacterised protein [Enterobacter cloacae]SAE87458.1 Uncharacterised protein [Enterobacter asburiae]